MRKIIITVIATFFMIAPLEKAKGQIWVDRRQQENRLISADFPTTNILTGVNTRLSFGIWRFELFVQIGQFFQVFDERMTTEGWIYDWVPREPDGREGYWDWRLRTREEFHSSRLESTLIFDYGIVFRVADRHRVKIGMTGMPFLIGVAGFGTNSNGCWLGSTQHYSYLIDGTVASGRIGRGLDWRYFYLGYMHSIDLSQRVRLDLNVQYGTTLRSLGDINAHLSILTLVYQQINFGVRLNYEVVRNLRLNVQFGYTRRYSVRERQQQQDWWYPLGNIETVLTRNLLDFSIGIHYHIQFGVQPQQAQQRPPRQRVAPYQRALPCPPGQMRHLRSWDRPSSVFNHPTAR